jgi:hypothetical protein
MTQQLRPAGPAVIYLDAGDDIVSIRDRLDWSRAPRAILVLPPEGKLLGEFLDLRLLRRHADSLRLDVGLVTPDSEIASLAQTAGIPAFASLDAAGRAGRRRWRPRRPRLAGRPTSLDRDDKVEVRRRHAPRPAWQRWALRYLAILLYLATLAALFVSAAYAIPGATVTLEPEVTTLRVTRQIVADPQLESVSYSGVSVPARVLTAVQQWEANVETSGTIEVADSPARGRIVFVNLIDQPVTVPAGTRLSTSAGTRNVFQTLDPIEVPGAIGATAETAIVAIEPGTTGNVDSGQINRIDGPLTLQLEARNLEPTEGGGVRLEKAVTAADLERLRAQVMQQLQMLALGIMEDALTDQEFLARDSLHVSRILHETYSHFPGERSDRLALDLRAELEATAVDRAEAIGLAYEELARSVTPGFELVPDSLEFTSGEVLGVDAEGRVTFEMIAEGLIAARLNVDPLLEQVAGQDVGAAEAYLYEHLPLRDTPAIRVWPEWFGRLPYLPVRIQTEIVTDSPGA